MQDLPKLIRYFRDCYEADNKDLNLWDVLHDKVEHRYFVPKEEELLTGHLPILPLPEVIGKDMETTLTLFEREKELYYTSFFLLAKGYSTGLKSSNTIISPLLLHPAELEPIEDDYYARPDMDQRYLNTQILRRLQNELNLPVTDHFEELQQVLPEQHWDLGEAGKLKRLINQWLPSADTEALLNYPELFSERQVKALFKKLPQKGIMVVPASVLFITAKSESTRSILNDLGELCDSNHFSSALRALFYPAMVAPRGSGQLETGHLPVMLNAAQEQIIKAANTYPISQITGPPGTGKSYTIAAMAAELASKGQKVLIASRTDAAVDVIHEKIEHDLKLKNIAIRGGRRGYNRKLYFHITGLLSGSRKTVASISTAQTTKREMAAKLDDINKNIKKLETLFAQKVANEMEWGAHLALEHKQKRIGAKLKNAYIALRQNWQDSIGSTVKQLDTLRDQRSDVSAKYIKLCFDLHIAEGLNSHRELFNQFAAALGSKSATANEQQIEQLNADVLTSIFPIWVVNVADLRKILPMKMEMFDVAIIDEATQCDTACFLPLIQRAKRVVVAGDPKQLRHVSFLSYARQKALMGKHDLGQHWQHICNYRDSSLLDVVTAALQKGEQVSFLNEHYRSRPPIIQFSNREFYDRQLNIMTERPEHEHTPSLFHYPCNGQRGTQGCNHAEAEALMSLLTQLVLAEQDVKKNARSIGVVSPFRKQADYLADLIAKAFDSKAITKHRIMVGTAYIFQGAERDIMLLSLSVDHASHHSAFVHINKPDVFNVSITRARVEQHVFSSVMAQKLPKNNVLCQYMEYLQDPEQHHNEEEDQEFDSFQEEVAKVLKKKFAHADVKLGYTIAGLVIDLVVVLNGKVYGIDLIGYPGQYQEAFALERYRMYRRAGVHLYPLAYSHWMFQREVCVAELMKFFK